MVEKKTEISSSEDSFIYRRNSHVLNTETFKFKQENIPFLITLLSDLYPELSLNDYSLLRDIANKEFGMNASETDFERYFGESMEGWIDEYNYKLKMI